MEINRDRADNAFFELVFAEVLKSDAGTYSCTASNKYGQESCECKMTVCGNYKLTNMLPVIHLIIHKSCLQRTRTSSES